MRTSIVIAAALFGITVACVGAADSPRRYGDSDGDAFRTQPGNTSTYKLRVAVNYPNDVAESSPADDHAGQRSERPYAQSETSSPYSLEQERVLREERERETREREEREEREQGERAKEAEQERERERIRLAEETERAERLRRERENTEREQAELERRERVERDRLERELAERERIERERTEHERAVRSFSDRLRTNHTQDDQEIVLANNDSGVSDNAPLVTIDEFPTDSLSSHFSPEPVKSKPKVLATLHGTPITEDDVAREMWLRRGRETFDWLIGRDILRRELERLDLRVTDSEIRASLDKHLDVLRKAYPKLRKRDDLTRAASGMPLEEYRERTVWTELALRKIMRVSLETRDEDLRRFYASVRADYIRPERVRISQIFIPPQINPDSDGIADNEAWLRAERQIREAHTLLRRQDFSDVAKLFGSGNQLSRWVKRGDLLRELEGPAFSILPDSITTPIKSSMGWHMLMVEAREDRQEPTLDEVRGEVLSRYEEERFVRLAGEFMARLKEKALNSGGLVMVDMPDVFAETPQ